MRTGHVRNALHATLVVLVPHARPAHAKSVPCDGPVDVTTSNFSSQAAGGVAVNRFDFTGTAPMCLADGTTVPGALVGSTLVIVHSNGSGTIVAQETLTIAGGSTLDLVVRARFAPSTFDGRIVTRGGTGDLAGVSGRGTFFPVAPPTGPEGPTHFFSSMIFEYH